MAIVQPIDQSNQQRLPSKASKEISPGPAAKHVTPPDPRSLPTPTDFLQQSGQRSAGMSMDQLWSALQHSGPMPEMKQERFAPPAGRGRGASPLNPSVQQFFAQHADGLQQPQQAFYPPPDLAAQSFQPIRPPLNPSHDHAPQPQVPCSTNFVPLQVSIKNSRRGPPPPPSQHSSRGRGRGGRKNKNMAANFTPKE